MQSPVSAQSTAEHYKKRTISSSVRDLVEFVLRAGDLGGSGGFMRQNRALEGTRGHQSLQRQRPLGYQAEVRVSWLTETPEFILELQGRIDGVWIQAPSVLIEEIKTVDGPWSGSPDPLHWAQAKIYAHLYLSQNRFEECTIQLTYLELDSGHVASFRESCTASILAEFFQRVLSQYLDWMREQYHWERVRDASIKELVFPFRAYRAGQRSLAVAAYRTIKSGGKLFAEAPTGIGKTISVLFPAIKAMGQGEVEKIFYLTAKTVGRAVAEKTLSDLRIHGLRLRTVTITARDKICFNNGQPCDVTTCPFAIGYYDRIKKALRAAFAEEFFTREAVERIAREHQVCPFEFSLDLSLWCDAVICDYNYAFDPSVMLKRHFAEERHDYALLVDEAHNLVDRARGMFSADLERAEIEALKSIVTPSLPALGKALSRMASRLSAISKEEGWIEREGALVSKSPPQRMTKSLKQFLDEAERWLVQNKAAEFTQRLLDLYFRVLAFQRTLELYDACYVTIYEHERGVLRLFCIDPANLLAQAAERAGSAIFFSATLSPPDYFREALGGGPTDSLLQLGSPFPREHLFVLIQEQIPTRLRARALSYDAVAGSIAAFVNAKRGNYLVYFPSYEYLNEVIVRFRTLCPDANVQAQTTGMAEDQREEFLARFQENPPRGVVAFAVLGGIFGEGIDLVGERLIGVVVVGIGLPLICLERDLIRERCENRGRPGFEFAYSYPGMNRVLQAVGRLIRSDEDRGVVLLIDERFGKRAHQQLFPAWWNPQRVNAPEQISARVQEFWQRS